MTRTATPGARLRQAVQDERPLQVVGAVNAYHAIMAERTGYKTLYLSGGGVAACSFGLPDLGVTSLNDVLEDVRRITYATALPLLVDADTGWGGAFNIARTVREMQRAGAAGVHIEDQVATKRCGHRPNKAIVSKDEMVDRVKKILLTVLPVQLDERSRGLLGGSHRRQSPVDPDSILALLGELASNRNLRVPRIHAERSTKRPRLADGKDALDREVLGALS